MSVRRIGAASPTFRIPRRSASASLRAVALLGEVIDSNGHVVFGSAVKHTPALIAALPEFKQIPARFRDFLIDDLALANDTCDNLEQAVASAREAAAERLGCVATWDAILENADALGDLTRPWRERVAAA